MGDGRGGHGARLENIHPGADHTGGERGFQHIPGEASVLADDGSAAMLAVHEYLTESLAEGKGDFRSYGVEVSLSTNSVGSKELSFHRGMQKEFCVNWLNEERNNVADDCRPDESGSADDNDAVHGKRIIPRCMEKNLEWVPNPDCICAQEGEPNRNSAPYFHVEK